MSPSKWQISRISSFLETRHFQEFSLKFIEQDEWNKLFCTHAQQFNWHYSNMLRTDSRVICENWKLQNILLLTGKSWSEKKLHTRICNLQNVAKSVCFQITRVAFTFICMNASLLSSNPISVIFMMNAFIHFNLNNLRGGKMSEDDVISHHFISIFQTSVSSRFRVLVFHCIWHEKPCFLLFDSFSSLVTRQAQTNERRWTLLGLRISFHFQFHQGLEFFRSECSRKEFFPKFPLFSATKRSQTMRIIPSWLRTQKLLVKCTVGVVVTMIECLRDKREGVEFIPRLQQSNWEFKVFSH